MIISLLLYLFDLNFVYSTSTIQQNSYMMQSQCHGLNPVYSNQGALKGYRGICNVSKWNGVPGHFNSMHPIDTNLLAFNHQPIQKSPTWLDSLFGTTPVTHSGIKIKYKQPSDLSLFDWLSPHHDIIRNHPHYRHAHLRHRHCIRRKHTGLFEYIGNIFGFGSGHPDHDHLSINDPYDRLSHGSRCLNSQYYKSNPFVVNDNQYDPYSLHLAHRINHIHHQLKDPLNTNFDELNDDLHSHYDRLHRHLDCHCHHELPHSRKYRIHHRPIGYHSMNMIAQPNMEMNSIYPAQIHSSMNFDPSMDMEDEHMAMLRMSGMAAQHAYNMGQNVPDSNYLQMQMFHPVNSYGQALNDPEWNRLRVEKVIVIKRLKVPVVRNVPVPMPVPVPYPVPSASSSTSGSFSQYSAYENVQPGYMGNNTYLIDGNDSPMQMDTIVQAISGAPCGCLNHQYSNSMAPDYNSMMMMNSVPNQFLMNQMPMNNVGFSAPTQQMYGQYPNSVSPPPNPMMLAQTMMQPGLQLAPSPYNYNNGYNQNNVYNHQSNSYNHHMQPQQVPNGINPVSVQPQPAQVQVAAQSQPSTSITNNQPVPQKV